jgi:hypothetical protein
LIRIEGHGLYRVLIPETGAIIQSRNVKFEEGLGHRTLTAEGKYFLDGLDNENGDDSLDFPNNLTTPGPNIENPQPRQTPDIRTQSRINYPPATHRSS